MLSVHSGREIPRKFGIEGITDDNLPGSISSALLEVVTTCYPLVVMADTAGPLRAIRNFAIDSGGIPIESLQNNFLVRGSLRKHRHRIEERKKENHQNGQKKLSRFLRHLSLILEQSTSVYHLKNSIF